MAGEGSFETNLPPASVLHLSCDALVTVMLHVFLWNPNRGSFPHGHPLFVSLSPPVHGCQRIGIEPPQLLHHWLSPWLPGMKTWP